MPRCTACPSKSFHGRIFPQHSRPRRADQKTPRELIPFRLDGRYFIRGLSAGLWRRRHTPGFLLLFVLLPIQSKYRWHNSNQAKTPYNKSNNYIQYTPKRHKFISIIIFHCREYRASTRVPVLACSFLLPVQHDHNRADEASNE